ncbi:MAG: rod shape-determining protein MreC [Clostridiaceae bacterium]|nr:rod shape-determining protein MreC [Eubacteriales bacterium]
MRGLFKNKPLLILLIAALLLGVLALVTSGNRTATWVESAVGTVATPVQGFASRASSAIAGFFQRIFKTTDADKENEQLKVKLAQYEQIEQKLEEARQENERLRALLNYAEAQDFASFVTARVIAKDQGVWFNVFTINAGRKQGVEEDMPVISAEGLVGRVTEVGATWSKVTAIVDTLSAASVMVERTRDNGMVRGILSGDGSERMELYYLPAGSDLVPGDVIVTNGLGGIFPKGVMVGTVIEVSRQSADIEAGNAILEPAVDFRHIEEVMVLIGPSAEAEEGTP